MRRDLLLAMLATLGAAGCRTAGTRLDRPTRPPEPAPARLRPRRVRRRAQPERRADREPGGQAVDRREDRSARRRSGSGGADGRLALERPRNFKLELYHGLRSTTSPTSARTTSVLVLVQNKKDKSVYVCNYDDLSSTSLAVTYQPDWIVEAMGLKPITPGRGGPDQGPAGAAARDDRPHLPATRSGARRTRVIMIVSDLTLRVQRVPDLRRRRQDDDRPGDDQEVSEPARGRRPAQGAEASRQPREPARCPRTSCSSGSRSSSRSTSLLKDVKVNQFDPARRTAAVRRADAQRVRAGEPGRAGPAEGHRKVRPPSGRRCPCPSREAVPGSDRRFRSEGPTTRPSASTIADGIGPHRAPCSCRCSTSDVVGAPQPTAPGARAQRTTTAELSAGNCSLDGAGALMRLAGPGGRPRRPSGETA